MSLPTPSSSLSITRTFIQFNQGPFKVTQSILTYNVSASQFLCDIRLSSNLTTRCKVCTCMSVCMLVSVCYFMSHLPNDKTASMTLTLCHTSYIVVSSSQHTPLHQCHCQYVTMDDSNDMTCHPGVSPCT